MQVRNTQRLFNERNSIGHVRLGNLVRLQPLLDRCFHVARIGVQLGQRLMGVHHVAGNTLVFGSAFRIGHILLQPLLSRCLRFSSKGTYQTRVLFPSSSCPLGAAARIVRIANPEGTGTIPVNFSPRIFSNASRSSGFSPPGFICPIYPPSSAVESMDFSLASTPKSMPAFSAFSAACASSEVRVTMIPSCK